MKLSEQRALYHTCHASSKNWYFCPSICIYIQSIITSKFQKFLVRYSKCKRWPVAHLWFEYSSFFSQLQRLLLKVYNNFVSVLIGWKWATFGPYLGHNFDRFHNLYIGYLKNFFEFFLNFCIINFLKYHWDDLKYT